MNQIYTKEKREQEKSELLDKNKQSLSEVCVIKIEYDLIMNIIST